MREIKFRVYVPNEGLIDWEDFAYDFTILPNKDHFHFAEFFESFQDQGAVFMQYTGLKDKNGVEIYEGDIVEWYNFQAERQVKTVAWSEKGAGFLPNDLTKDPIVEVIGNIYENPELLESTAKK